jgi:hypothetical protein
LRLRWQILLIILCKNDTLTLILFQIPKLVSFSIMK